VKVDGTVYLEATGSGKIQVVPKGSSFKPISLRLTSTHSVRLIGHPAIGGASLFVTVRVRPGNQDASTLQPC
jgi:hypothetical protein